MATVKESLPSSLRIFTNLSEKELASIYNSLPSKRLKAKEILIKEGSPVSCLFVAVSGQIEALKEIDGANISIGYLERNTVYGSLVQEKDMVSTVTLIANEPTTVLCIDEKALILVKPDIKVKLLLNLSLIQSKMILATTDYTIKDKQKVIDMCRIKEKEYEAGREIIASSDKLLEKLKKIPSLPPYSFELSKMLMQEKISTDKIVDFIKSDPSLMAIVLKTVNSPYYNLSQKVSDFHHALLLLGFNQIYQMVMDNSLNNVIPNRPEFITLRDEAMIVSNLAFELGLISGFEKPIILSTIGTLHVIGKAIKILLSKEEEFGKIFNLCDDAIISTIILKEWKLSDLVCSSICYHKYPEFTTPDKIPATVVKIVSLIHFSKYSFDMITGNNNVASPFIDEYLRLIGLNMAIDEVLYKKLIPVLRKKIELMPRVLKEVLAEKV